MIDNPDNNNWTLSDFPNVAGTTVYCCCCCCCYCYCC